MQFEGKSVFITGASRGIGKAIGLALAVEGANITIAAKTAEPHPKLDGTIYTAAEEMRAAGGRALPLIVDIRDEHRVREAVAEAADKFGGIDILINNASAIMLTGTMDTPMKRYDLMHSVNTRGTFVASQACIPYLLKSENPHVMNISPPLNMEEKWFRNHVAYTMAKFGMSMCILGMAGEYRSKGIAFNALWPRTAIATAAVANLLGGDEMVRRSRTTDIMADAAKLIFAKASKSCTGNFFIDDEVLAEAGVTDFRKYQVDTSLELKELAPDFFL